MTLRYKTCIFDLTFTFRAFSRHFFSKAIYTKGICQKKEKHYFAVGTVRIFMEPNTRLTNSPYTTKIAKIRYY